MNKGASKAIPLIQIVRALLESGARREIGCNAFAMVIAVADAQDRLNRQGKDRPVAIYAREFARMTGMVEPETIRAARKRAIESGWLSYQRGKPRKPGLYQAHLPASFDGFTCFDAELDVADDVASDAESNGIIGGIICHNSHSLDLNPKPISSPSGSEVVGDQEQQGKAKPRRKKISVEYDLEAIPFPLRDTGFPDAWSAYLEHRAQLGKPVTLASQNQSFNRALKIGGDEATRKIETAIENSWIGWNWKDSNSQSKPPPQRPALPLFDPSQTLTDEPVFVPEDKADIRLKNKERTPN